jgi:hypothetical protein
MIHEPKRVEEIRRRAAAKLESLAKPDGKIATPEFVSQFRLALHWLNEHVFVGDSSRNKRTREQKTSKEEKSKFSSGCSGKGAFLLNDNNGGRESGPITFAMTALPLIVPSKRVRSRTKQKPANAIVDR